jgi:DNA-binding MarR family transcriptional regulator
MLLVASYLHSEDTGNEQVTVSEVLDKYSIEARPNWVRRAISSLTDEGYAKGRMHMGSERDQRVWLTAQGVKEAERLLDEEIVTIKMPENNIPIESPASTADSSRWTGLPSGFRWSEEKREKLIDQLGAIEGALDSSSLGNVDKAQARAYVVAARALAEAPEPEPDLIWEVLQRANAVSGIASLFVAIIALFVSGA